MSKTTTPKTPMAASRKKLIFGTVTAALVAACVVPIAAFAALDNGGYCVTATGYDGEFQGNKGICPAEPGAPTPGLPTEEPIPVETIAPLPEITPTSAPEDPASCDLDAANSAAEDLALRAMYSDPSSAINRALRSNVYDTQPVGYETHLQNIILSVDKTKAADAYCAGESLASAVSVDHYYKVDLRTTGDFMSARLGLISAKTTGTLADTKSVLTRQTLDTARTDGVYNGLDANLATIVSNEIRKDLNV
jgi:hypothetical protein